MAEVGTAVESAGWWRGGRIESAAVAESNNGRLVAMSSRHFTLTEAREMVPQIERLVTSIADRKQQIVQTRALIESVRRSAGADGSAIDSDTTDLERRASTVTGEVRELARELQETGVRVKDINKGLVDWTTIHDGHEVYLCWQRGEPTIEWWHEIADGYAGRRRIDADEWAT